MLRRFAHLALLVSIAALVGCTSVPEGVQPVHSFDAKRYAGQWYEIMRLDHSFERGLTHVTATYIPREDGSVGVVNKGFDRDACRWKEADGSAVFLRDRDTASLAVTFFWPFAGGYHVMALDREKYRWALVSGPSRDYLWILSRTPQLPESVRQKLIAEARSYGFPVERLISVEQGPLTCAAGQKPPA